MSDVSTLIGLHQALTVCYLGKNPGSITLTHSKCQFTWEHIRFCGYIIYGTGVQPYPAKTDALNITPAGKNVADVRRSFGIANQPGWFTPHLATLSLPLCNLWKDRDWCWNVAQQQAFDHIKAVLSIPANLVFATLTTRHASPQMLHRSVWGQYFIRNNWLKSGIRFLISRSHCWRLSSVTFRLKRRPLPAHGHANALITSSWDRLSPLKQTINHWYLSLVPKTSTIDRLESFDSNSV